MSSTGQHHPHQINLLLDVKYRADSPSSDQSVASVLLSGSNGNLLSGALQRSASKAADDVKYRSESSSSDQSVASVLLHGLWVLSGVLQ